MPEAPEEGAPVAEPPEITAAPEGDAPVGPSSEEETAFLAAQQQLEPADGSPPPPTGPAPDPEASAPLPPMEDLVKRIPAPAREAMEELFRARFVTVKRIPAAALK